jgi:hypothetical protein
VNDLARIDVIRRELSKARSIPKLAEVRGKASALERYLKQHPHLRTAAHEAVVVRMWAEWRIGELLDPDKEKRGGANSRGVSLPEGITHNQSSQWQRIVRELEEDEYAAILRGPEPTTGRALALAKRKERQRDEGDKSEGAPGAATILRADALDWFADDRANTADLLLTDPPYSTEWTEPDKFAAFVAEWVPAALALLKPTGRAYIFVGAYLEEIRAYTQHLEAWTPTPQLLVWTYRNTLGPKRSSTPVAPRRRPSTARS